MKRLGEGIQVFVGDTEPPTREQIQKMPYLAMVIRESMKPEVCPQAKVCLFCSGLRISPPVPLTQPHSQQNHDLTQGRRT